jgi:hypothetical protein
VPHVAHEHGFEHGVSHHFVDELPVRRDSL